MPTLLFKLAARNSIAFPKDDPAFASEEALLERYNNFTSLDDFLGYYYQAMSVLVHAQDFEDLAYDYFLKAHADGVVHAEISFDPQAHLERGVPFATVISGLVAAREHATKELGISVEIICCILRHLPAQSGLELYRSRDFQAAVTAGQITGIGLDSSENAGVPVEEFVELYQLAGKDGLRRTAHAGEEGPASNIQKSLTLLGCERIDHGIKLAEDAALMEEVAQRKTLLTVCPMSNVKLRCVERIAQVPIRKFLEAGIQFSLNSDDPAYFGGFILDNYCAVQDAFELNVEEWKFICLAAIDGSWCAEQRKEEMKNLLNRVLER